MAEHPPAVSHLTGFAHHHPAVVVLAAAALGGWACHDSLGALTHQTDHGAPNPTFRDWVSASLPLTVAVGVAAALIYPAVAFRAAAVLAAVCVAAGPVVWWVTRKTRRHRKLTLAAHQAVYTAAGHQETTRPGKYLTARYDKTGEVYEVTVRPTVTAAAHPNSVKHIRNAVPQALGMGPCTMSEQMKGLTPRLVFTRDKPVPDLREVTWDMTVPALEKTSGTGKILVGLRVSDGKPFKASKEDFVHALFSARTGVGKSTIAALFAIQHRHDGGIVVILDPTGASAPWARNLPGVYYADDIHKTRKAAYWLEHRRELMDGHIRDHSDISGAVEEGPLEDVMAVVEERNLTETLLTDDWREQNDRSTGRDPALRCIDRVHFAGRKAGLYAVVPMVRGDANAAGGGAVRGQAGLLIFGANPKKSEWRMLTGEEDPPKSTSHRPPKGRIQVWFDGEVTEVQVPRLLQVPKRMGASAAEKAEAVARAQRLRDYALSGQPAVLPPELLSGDFPWPGRSDTATEGHEHEDEHEHEPGDLRERSAHALHAHDTVTLREAIEQGIVSGLSIRQLQNQTRDPGFPRFAGRRGKEKTYPRDQIIGWADRHVHGHPEPVTQPPESPASGGNVYQFRSRSQKENTPS